MLWIQSDRHEKRRRQERSGQGAGEESPPRRRSGRRGFREAVHRYCQLLERHRPGTHPPQRDRGGREGGHHRGRRKAFRVRSPRGMRRHRHGTQGHEVLPHLQGGHLRLLRGHGRGTRPRRMGRSLQLRQGHPGDADGRGTHERPRTHRDWRRHGARRGEGR